MLYSFDVFDTIITRATANPHGVFSIMEHRLCTSNRYLGIHPHIRENFCELRINAEIMARKCFNGREEITLTQIYDALSTTGELTDSQIGDIIELEIETELENVVPIPRMINQIRSLRESGKHVVLISDMYLDPITIRRLIMKVEPSLCEIPLYVSSEYGKTKNTGNLYKVVRDKENVSYENWIHTGDNIFSDIQRAKALGIKTNHVEFAKLLPYEIQVLREYGNDPRIQLAIGAARNTRLVNSANYRMEFGCSIGGPMLFNYVEWIIQRSLEMGMHYLYFVARDGYVLKKIADSIIRIKGLDIQTKYIYGSRSAWRMPSLTRDNFDISFVFNEAWALTDMNSLASTLGLEMEELSRFLPEKYSNGHYQPSRSELSEFKSILSDNTEFREFLCKKVEPKRHIVQAYLKQTIEWGKDNFAFVELRGTGKTMQCLADIVSDFWDKPIRVFYLELLGVNQKKNCVLYNWLPSRLYLAQTVEILCRAMHGQTVGYEYVADSIVPILEAEEGEALREYGYDDYISGVSHYTERITAALHNNNLYMFDPRIFLKYMDYITKTPDTEMLKFIGDMPFQGSSISGDNKIYKFAPVLTLADVERIYNTTKDRRSLVYNGSALELSELRSPPELRERIKLYISRR